MAEGDLIYDDASGWLIEGGGPLSESTDPFNQALWAVLSTKQVPAGATDEQLQAILDAALSEAGLVEPEGDGLEQAVRAAGYTGQWPPMTADRDKYTREPIPGTERVDSAEYARWVNIVQDLGFGADEPDEPAPPPPLRFDDKTKAEAEAQATGGVVVRRGGYYWVEDAPEARIAPEPSFNQQFDRLLLDGRYAEAQQLWDIREEITSQGGRMTRAQAAQFLTGDLFKAEEIPALLDALTGPRRATEGPLGQPVAPATPSGPPGQAGGLTAGEAQGAGAMGPGGALGQGLPPLAGAPPISPREPLGAFSQAAQGPFGMDPAEQAATGFAGAFARAAAAPQRTQRQGQAPFQRGAFPTSVEQFDPNFADASPEAQAAILAEFERQRATQTQGSSQAAPLTIADALKLAQGGDTAGANSLMQQLVGAGGVPPLRPSSTPQGQAIQEVASAQNATPPTGLVPDDLRLQRNKLPDVARVFGRSATPIDPNANTSTPQGASFWDALKRREAQMRGTGPSGQVLIPVGQAGALGNVPPPATPPTPPPIQPPATKTMTFADAIAQINERRRHRQLLAKPQGRTIFA